MDTTACLWDDGTWFPLDTREGPWNNQLHFARSAQNKGHRRSKMMPPWKDSGAWRTVWVSGHWAGPAGRARDNGKRNGSKDLGG